MQQKINQKGSRSKFVNIASVTDMNGQNDKLFILDLGKDTIIANSKAPQVFQCPNQLLAKTKRTNMFYDFLFKMRDNSLLDRAIKFSKGFFTTLVNHKSPFFRNSHINLVRILFLILLKKWFFLQTQGIPYKRQRQFRILPDFLNTLLKLFSHNSFWRDLSSQLKHQVLFPGFLINGQRAWQKILFVVKSYCRHSNTCHTFVKLLFLISIFSSPLQAGGIGSDLLNFFNRSGMVSNTTSPKVYKDQAAGYYSGGSVVTRNSVKNAQIGNIQMPGFRAGCGGIDMWLGGISHIKGAQLVQALRAVGTNMASYAFMLGVQTVSPMVYNLMNELNALATQINQTNINSCEVAATALGGIWPKTDSSSKHLCTMMGSNLGVFSDHAAARQGCGAQGERENVLNRKGENAAYKDMLVGEFNLAWKVINSNSFLKSDPELARLFMTLVGSIIVRKANENYQAINLAGHADRDDVLNGLLNGGQTPIYKCDTNDKCLFPTMENITLNDSHALLRKTHSVLESLINKIYNDSEASQEEKDFLNSTRLPVYKMLNVTTAYRKGHAPIDIHQYGDLIALDILYKYVLEIIDILHDSAAQLKAVQVDDAHMDRFLKQLRIARERITERRQSAYQHMDTTLSFIKSTQLIEKQLHIMMGSIYSDEGM